MSALADNFEDNPVRYLVHRGHDDKVDWYFKVYTLPRSLFKGGASTFWELRGFFSRLYSAKTFDMGTWVNNRRTAWCRLWDSEGVLCCDLRDTQSQTVKDHLAPENSAFALKTHARETVMGTQNLLAVLCDFAVHGRGRVVGAAKEGLAYLASSSIVDAASVRCGTGMFGRCAVGRDASGMCSHCQVPVARLDALNAAGPSLGVVVAEAVATDNHKVCMDAAALRSHLLATLARALDERAPNFSTSPEDIPLLMGAKRAKRIDTHWVDRVAVGLKREGRVKSATMAGRFINGRRRVKTYADTATKVMSKYAWNIPKTFSGVYQICTATDGSGKAGAERLSTAVCSFRVSKGAWLPPQARATLSEHRTVSIVVPTHGVARHTKQTCAYNKRVNLQWRNDMMLRNKKNCKRRNRENCKHNVVFLGF